MIRSGETVFAAELTIGRGEGRPEQKKALAGEEQRALLAREGLKSSQSPASAAMV
jgi:hypothetical protein